MYPRWTLHTASYLVPHQPPAAAVGFPPLGRLGHEAEGLVSPDRVSSHSKHKPTTWHLKPRLSQTPEASSVLGNSDPVIQGLNPAPMLVLDTEMNNRENNSLDLTAFIRQSPESSACGVQSPHIWASVSHVEGCPGSQAVNSTLAAVWINHRCPYWRELIAFGNTAGTRVCLVKDVGRDRGMDAPNFTKRTLRITGPALPNLQWIPPTLLPAFLSRRRMWEEPWPYFSFRCNSLSVSNSLSQWGANSVDLLKIWDYVCSAVSVDLREER